MGETGELKPCPFCGGEAEMLTAESMHGGDLFGIMCQSCCSRGDVYDTEAEAIEAWNTRTERTCKRITLGLEREREIATVSWICSACGKHINKDHEYCHNCGAKVVSE